MIVILGGGLAGLATAYFLRDLRQVVLEAEAVPGGLCRSRTIDGFVFDYTGHLLHLRDPRAVEARRRVVAGRVRGRRRATHRSVPAGSRLPFPFQANLHGLPKEIVADCILGAAEALARTVPDDPALSFRDWSLRRSGRGISDAFMFPYNTKLFRRDPEDMTADWVSWAVPRPNLAEVVRGALGIDERAAWATTRPSVTRSAEESRSYPNAFAASAEDACEPTPASRPSTSTRKRVTLASGETIVYDRLVSTIPLPHLLGMAAEEASTGQRSPRASTGRSSAA